MISESTLRRRAKRKGYKIEKKKTGYIATDAKTGGIAIAKYNGPNFYEGLSFAEMEEKI